MKNPILAAYLRLSRSDAHSDAKKESNSIRSQRLLIKNYLSLYPDLLDMPYREYVDDGYSGTNTNRPAFQKLLSHARAGRIGVIIVKDMSRFSREYLVLGDYVEQMFPFLGIRFISINDHYDSRTSLISSADTMNAALQSLVYDYYSKDLSRKRSSSVAARMKNRKFLGPAPYGYISNFQEHRYEIDPESAQVVKRIFSMAAEGIRPTAIANHLNKQNIPTPARYNKEHPELHKTGGYSKSSHPMWTYHSVQRILKDPVYCGILELGKSYRTQPNQSSQTDCTIRRFENAHAPIISEELFQSARKAQERPPGSGYKKKTPPLDTPLVGFLTCGYCGLNLRFHAFSKTAYCIQSRMQETICPKDLYPLDEIESYILKELRQVLNHLADKRKHWDMKIEAGKKQQLLYSQRIALLLKTKERLLEEKRILFESYTNGSCSEETFLAKKQALSLQAEDNLKELGSLQNLETKLSSLEVPPDLLYLSDTASGNLKDETLTKELLQTYVNTVIVYGPHDFQIQWKRSILPYTTAKGDHHDHKR